MVIFVEFDADGGQCRNYHAARNLITVPWFDVAPKITKMRNCHHESLKFTSGLQLVSSQVTIWSESSGRADSETAESKD